MGAFIEGSRNNCALHGALQTIRAIEGAVPVIHSTAGCGMQHFLGGNPASGGVNPGRDGGPPVSSTNISEKHVVFGGYSRLREQLKNTVKVVRGDVYVVLTGCATEMVGDDIPAMTKEARDQGFPAVYANTPGFRGDVHRGYELAVKALIEQLPGITGGVPPGKEPRLVNIWGIIPQQDAFWQGHLRELARLLASLGLEANTLFGHGQGIGAWQRIPRAGLNLAVSPWGVEAARLLEEKYGTPWLDVKFLPVGANATGLLLEALTERLYLDSGRTAALRREEETGLAHYLAGIADVYFAADFQREFALVGETQLVTGLADFLVTTLGLIPRVVIITDNPPEAMRGEIAGRVQKLAAGFDTKVVFNEDRGEISDIVRASGAELVLGSYLEGEAAQALGAPLVQVSFPLAGRVVLSKGYVGYRGAVSFIEDLGSALLSAPGEPEAA